MLSILTHRVLTQLYQNSEVVPPPPQISTRYLLYFPFLRKIWVPTPTLVLNTYLFAIPLKKWIPTHPHLSLAVGATFHPTNSTIYLHTPLFVIIWPHKSITKAPIIQFNHTNIRQMCILSRWMLVRETENRPTDLDVLEIDSLVRHTPCSSSGHNYLLLSLLVS